MPASNPIPTKIPSGAEFFGCFAIGGGLTSLVVQSDWPICLGIAIAVLLACIVKIEWLSWKVAVTLFIIFLVCMHFADHGIAVGDPGAGNPPMP